MNEPLTNTELDQLLKSARVPARVPEFWERMPQRVSAKLHWQQHRKNKENNLPSRSVRGWVLGITGAAVLILSGFMAGNWHGGRQTTALLQNEKLLREVLATFPNQVRAIVQDENGLHLLLAEEPNVSQSQPFWIKVCEGDTCRSMVTFSGQTVSIAGRKVEVLADARNGVMLVGEHFFWSTHQKGNEGRLRISAQPLGFVL
jgi:hypothetical protein